MSKKQTIIKQIAKEVKNRLEGESSGHDWWHTAKVWSMAKRIGEKERADMFVVELAALLHDIADWKFYDGDDTIGPRVAGKILNKYKVSKEITEKVQKIISMISFKGARVKTGQQILEGTVVQDADRLDALGAIGIARVFAYSGFKNRPIYIPGEKPIFHQTKESYVKKSGSAINHFYEKLLLLKKLMNTKTAKKLAEERHRFMKRYLDQFFREWNSKA